MMLITARRKQSKSEKCYVCWGGGDLYLSLVSSSFLNEPAHINIPVYARTTRTEVSLDRTLLVPWKQYPIITERPTCPPATAANIIARMAPHQRCDLSLQAFTNTSSRWMDGKGTAPFHPSIPIFNHQLCFSPHLTSN